MRLGELPQFLPIYLCLSASSRKSFINSPMNIIDLPESSFKSPFKLEREVYLDLP